jgi:hypothetical protein
MTQYSDMPEGATVISTPQAQAPPTQTSQPAQQQLQYSDMPQGATLAAPPQGQQAPTQAPPVTAQNQVIPKDLQEPEHGSDEWYARTIAKAAPEGSLEKAQKYLVDPFERLVSWGQSGGHAVGEQLGMLSSTALHPGEYFNAVKGGKGAEYLEAQAHKNNPWLMGAAEGVGSTAGGVALDPRNWPLMGAGDALPVLNKLLAAGFGTMMTKGAWGAAKELATNWDAMTPEQRSELATQAGLSTVMATATALHLAEGVKKGVKGAVKGAVLQQTTPVVKQSPMGAQIPVRPETTLGKAVAAGDPEGTAQFAQTRTAPAVQQAVGGTIGEAIGSEAATTSTPEDRMGIKGHANDLIENQARPAYQAMDKLSEAEAAKAPVPSWEDYVKQNKGVPRSELSASYDALKKSNMTFSEIQERIDNARGDFSKEGRVEFKEAQAQKTAMMDKYRDQLKTGGHDIDAADTAYRKGKAAEKMAKKFDTATGPSTVEGAPWELDGKKLMDVVDKGVKDGLLKAMGLTDEHIDELQSLAKTAAKQTKIESTRWMSNLGKLAVMASGIHGGVLAAAEAVSGVSAADYVGGKISKHLMQDAMTNYDATKAMRESLKTGDAQPVVDALSKDPSWVARTKAFVQDIIDKRPFKGGGETGAVGANVKVRHAGDIPYDEMLKAHNEEGGATFDKTGNLKGQDKWSVGTHGERTENVPAGEELTADHLRQFATKNEDLLAKKDHALGSWKDGKGNHVIDVVKTFKDEDAATRAGKINDQEGIFHLGGKGFKETGGTGKTPTMKTLHHWSNVEGLTETDPEKMGTGKAGREMARAGEPGFVKRTNFGDESYKEAAIQGQAHHYTAEVNHAKYYDVDKDPAGIWQEALRKDGPTAAEKAIHDAGYDGYQSKGEYAAFEKVPVKSAQAATPTQVNASGESAASLEAQNRLKSQQAQGLRTYDVDSRKAGSKDAWHPVMASVDAVDQKASPFHHLVQVDATGKSTILDSGEGARPLPSDDRIQSLIGQAAGKAPITPARPVDMSGSEIATRYPSSTTAVTSNDPANTSGLDALNEADRQAPSRMTQAGKPVLGVKQKLAAALADYKDNGVSSLLDAADPDAAIEKYIEHVKNNLKWLHDSMPESIRKAARGWYETAHNVTKDIAQKNGITHEQSAAVTAALSPKNDWNNNVGQAKRLIEHYANDQGHAWTDKMDQAVSDIRNNGAVNDQFKRMLSDIRGKKLNELKAKTPEALLAKKALWYRVLDEAHGSKDTPIYSPDGTISGSQTLNWGQVDPIAKALSILEDGSVENIHSVMGEGHKIRNFYNNIINPFSERGHTTIDTHAVGAGLLKPLSQDDVEVAHNFGSGNKAGTPSPAKHAGTGVKGSYSVHEEAYRRAAKELGLQPRELQSITWEGIRSLMGDEKKTPELRRAVSEIWRAHENGHFTLNEAREKILEHSGGFTKPNWMSDEQWEANPTEQGDTSFGGQ